MALGQVHFDVFANRDRSRAKVVFRGISQTEATEYIGRALRISRERSFRTTAEVIAKLKQSISSAVMSKLKEI